MEANLAEGKATLNTIGSDTLLSKFTISSLKE